jgi:hypothetical protein
MAKAIYPPYGSIFKTEMLVSSALETTATEPERTPAPRGLQVKFN